MVVAICCDSHDEYAVIEAAVKEYARANKCMFPARWFSTIEDFRRENSKHCYDIVIVACDDIVNQELAVSARDMSKISQIVWIGKDTRFGLASYRVGVANFILKPATEKAIWESLNRCRKRMKSDLEGKAVQHTELVLEANLDGI